MDNVDALTRRIGKRRKLGRTVSRPGTWSLENRSCITQAAQVAEAVLGLSIEQTFKLMGGAVDVDTLTIRRWSLSGEPVHRHDPEDDKKAAGVLAIARFLIQLDGHDAFI